MTTPYPKPKQKKPKLDSKLMKLVTMQRMLQRKK